MTKIEARTLKGFPDYGPAEQFARQQMFSKIQTVFQRFGFLPMSTPALEYKDILMGKYGDEEKLVYSFKDNGDRDVALRYDLTVPFARFMAMHLNTLALPFKRYQIAPVWRAENTQKGRLREFYQCDIDTVGTESEFPGPADAEVVACFGAVLQELGIENFVARINDRTLFEMFAGNEIESEQLPTVIRCVDKLDKIGIDGVAKLMEERGIGTVLQGKILELLSWGTGDAVLEKIEAMSDEGAARVQYWRRLLDTIAALGLPKGKVVFDPTIARGLEYYTSIVFEFSLTGVEGYGSIVGGGRYNNLLSTFSDKSLPAVGGSLGIDRLYEYLAAQQMLPENAGVEVVVLNLGEQTWEDSLRVTAALRNAGVNADLYYDAAKLDKQFKYAEGKGARLAIIIGAEEKAKGMVKVKNLKTREQVEVMESELLAAVRST